jgi:hypothetical protein
MSLDLTRVVVYFVIKMQGFTPQPNFIKKFQPVAGGLPQSGQPPVQGFRPNIVTASPMPKVMGGFKPISKQDWGRGFQKAPTPASRPTPIKGFTRTRQPVSTPATDEFFDPDATAKRTQRFKTEVQLKHEEDKEVEDEAEEEEEDEEANEEAEEENEDEEEEEDKEVEEEAPKPVKPRPKTYSASGVDGMCTIEEAQDREQGNLLSYFEMEPDKRGKAKLDWAVKTYTRSGAGVEQGENIRSEEQIQKTLRYLLDNILDVDLNDNPNHYQLPSEKESHDFLDIFEFLSDRFRAICKDYNIMKPMTSDLYLTTLRLIARFHILASSQGLEFPRFDAKPNSDRLQDVLTTLNSLYQHRRSKGLECPGEDEMLHFSMLLHLPRSLEFHRQLHASTGGGFLDKFALECFVALQNQDFVRFFKCFEKADYLSACLLQQHFDLVRTAALKALLKAYNSLPLETVMNLLRIDDQDFALDYLSFRGMCFLQDKTCIVSFKDSELIDTKYRPTHPENQVELKKQDQLRSVLVKSPFTLPTLEESVVQTTVPLSKPKPPPMPAVPLPTIGQPEVIPFTPVIIEQPKQITIVPQVPFKEIPPPVPPYVPPPPPEPRKSKSNTYSFPSETKDLLRLCEDDSSRRLFKAAVKQYRRQIKLRTGQKLKNETHHKLLTWFNRWLRQTALHAYSEYIDQRYTAEMHTFAKQFHAPSSMPSQQAPERPTISAELAEICWSLQYFKLVICCETAHLGRTVEALSLRHDKLILKRTPEDALGADLLVVVCSSQEYLRLFKHRYPRVLLLCVDCDPGEINAREVLPYQVSEWNWETSMTPSNFWSHLLKPALIQSTQRPWKTLTTMTFNELPGLYQVWFESVSRDVRLRLNSNHYDAAKLWVSELNSFAESIYNSCLWVADYPPAPEVFPDVDLSLLSNFDEASRGLQWLKFNELPSEEELPEFCSELVMWFLSYFSSAQMTQEFESILSRATIFRSQGSVVGPWSKLFCTAVSAKLSALQRLPGCWLQGR